MPLFTHAPDPQGIWLDAKGGRYHIIGYDNDLGRAASSSFSAGQGRSNYLRSNPWKEAETEYAYSKLVSLEAAGPIAGAEQIFFDDTAGGSPLGVDNVQDALDLLDLQTARTPLEISAPGAALTAGRTHFVDSSGMGSPATVTLPAAPADGTVVRIIDPYRSFRDNPLSVTASGGDTIDGDAEFLAISDWGSYEMVYHAATAGWVMQQDDQDAEMHSMEIDTTGVDWAGTPYAGLYCERKQLWDGQVYYYFTITDYYADTNPDGSPNPSAADGVVHEVLAGTWSPTISLTAPNALPAPLRIFTKSQVNGLVSVAP